MTATVRASTKVREVMTRDPITVHLGETVHEAMRLMSENRIGAIPVVGPEGRCVGILSDSDLLEVARDAEGVLEAAGDDVMTTAWAIRSAYERIGQERVESVMSEAVRTIGPDQTIAEAARQMLAEHVHHLPVVEGAEGEERLVGMVSSYDLLQQLAAAKG